MNALLDVYMSWMDHNILFFVKHHRIRHYFEEDAHKNSSVKLSRYAQILILMSINKCFE